MTIKASFPVEYFSLSATKDYFYMKSFEDIELHVVQQLQHTPTEAIGGLYSI